MERQLDAHVGELRLASIRSSLDTYASQLRCWMRFCAVTGAPLMPPEERTVARYVSIFRNSDSANKYLYALRWGCDFLGVSVAGWDTRSLHQVVKGLGKLRPSSKKKAHAIRWDLQRLLI